MFSLDPMFSSKSRSTDTLAVLDIGTNEVKIVVVSTPSVSVAATNLILQIPSQEKPKPEVIGIGRAISSGLRKGVLINLDATVASISEALKEAEKSSGIRIREVVATVTGAHLKSLNSHGVTAIRKKEVGLDDIDRVIEAAKAVAIPSDREVLHIVPQEFIIDGQDSIKEPLGISGVRLESRVHIITGSIASAENIVKSANKAGVAVSDFVVAPIAASWGVLTNDERDLGIAVIDIGAGTTDIAVFQGGAVRHTAVLPYGGNQITADVAAGLRITVEAAEKIKCDHGAAMVSLCRFDERVAISSAVEPEKNSVARKTIAEIIEPRVRELISLAHQEIARSGYEQLLRSGIVLTGGTSKLAGIQDIAEQACNIPVRLGKGIWQGRHVEDPCLATTFGVLNFALDKPAQRHFEENKPGSGMGGFLKNVGNWFREQI